MTVDISNESVAVFKNWRMVATGQKTGQLYKTNIELRVSGGTSSEAGAMAAKWEFYDCCGIGDLATW